MLLASIALAQFANGGISHTQVIGFAALIMLLFLGIAIASFLAKDKNNN